MESATTAGKAPAAPYTTEVAPGVHAFVQPDGGWCLNNAGFVTGSGATILIDTAATVARAEHLRDTVAAAGAPAPRLVINTHYHGDHTYGNCVFTPEATVVGHAGCRREVIAAGLDLPGLWPNVTWGDVRVSPPTVTYTDRLVLHAGETEVELIHPGEAHTTGDSIVWIPEHRVVFTGDLVFSGGTPFVLMGTVEGSLRALDQLRELGATTVVPGHGPLCGPEVYDTCERYLRFVTELAARGHARGRAPLDVALETDLGEFAALGERERLVGNLHRAYAELDGLPPGAPIDYIAAITDMAAFSGGDIPCRA
ncbi:MBL fold metallo-hydrolase [Wenjunlia tyrosinilytica]|uniref:MBL fold metallo-hydrolase n=1 Tax=Wenjunlia tyrosinilytica TaxID=1544741 RepID=A0A917ZSK3_9ACTN|nr:MBL fold metallo-hydrolase [Wenjunlia tyrosinilytica]GGO91168.1 MBL fold metallo-hydrolase [Wenjunlia tyrosinilytica]